MALKIPFPYHPANKFHAGIKVRFEAEAETPQSIDLLADKVDNGSKGTQKAIGDVARAIKGFPDGERSKQIFERLTVAIETVAIGLQKQPNGEAIDKKLGEIGKSLHQIDRTMQSFGVPEKDNVTALYAAAVDTTGDIVGRTTAGQWLNQAKFASLHEIVAFQKGKPQDVRRTEFIKRMRGVPAIDHGLPAVISDSELVRFFELAPAVWKAIEDSPDPSSQQPPKA
ncbi:hypothetical protein [Mesorhizobium loti]|uniref:Uncharacterized protein n=1 Tax=Mesorhizobium loti R88b TaxID=935548 RepID=A0A6M7X0T7_RHILI|nr:hypothetical protein [Mesorhizobium loti]QKD06703.1 hypothetical protein EB235_31430 [Mesorhizobium loti R88b]